MWELPVRTMNDTSADQTSNGYKIVLPYMVFIAFTLQTPKGFQE